MFLTLMEIGVSWRMKYFLFMGIGIYVNEFLVYLLLLFSGCQKVVYFF